MTFFPGMLVKSKAGRDKGCIYVIIDVNAEYVYLADGVVRTVRRPKRKNKKHLQIIKKDSIPEAVNDETVRVGIRRYLGLTEGKKQELSDVQED